MGHQVNFFAAPADIAALQRRICEIEPVLFLHSRSETEQPRVLSSLAHIESGRPWIYYYLVRESDLKNVVTSYVPAQRYWIVETLYSPAVEFTSCFFDGTILRRGRMYYVDGFYGENGEWIEKSEVFRSWAKAVLKTTKKILKLSDSYYIGPAATEWVAHNNGKFAP